MTGIKLDYSTGVDSFLIVGINLSSINDGDVGNLQEFDF